jgi:hypothetical protein
MMTLDSPFVIFAISVVTLTLSVRLGILLQRVRQEKTEASHSDLSIVTTASLTLLALLISFSFSMATSRYDLRGNIEVEEAREISAEYFRADLLPAENAAQVKALLKSYMDQRIDFYNDGDAQELEKAKMSADRLQDQLWTATRTPAMAAPSSITALPVAGVDSIFNSRREAEAAWENRIPPSAAFLLLVIAACANMLTGLGAKSPASRLHFILPLLVSVAFFLIADIENPRAGLIRVSPTDLMAAADSMHAH